MNNKKSKNSLHKRLPIWQKKLSSPEGVSISEMDELCQDLLMDSESPLDTLRQDIHKISQLLDSCPNSQLIRVKVGRKCRYRLEGDADIIRLWQEKFYGSETISLLGMLHQMEGVLPEGVLDEITARIKKLESDQSESSANIVIAYETNGAGQSDNGHFYPIYKAIHAKQAVRVTFHTLQSNRDKQTIILHPEFLRQHRTLWYALGYATNTEGVPLQGECTRVPLHLIDEVSLLSTVKVPFHPTGIDDYLDEYFSEIIGIDNVFELPAEEVRFALHKRMLPRLQVHPLHESMSILKSVDSGISNYVTCRMVVKENKELIRCILEMGSDIVILSPYHLRRKIAKEIRKLQQLYSE